MKRLLAEKFVSINGEGKNAGLPAVFIRFAGCNLNCGYCDTKWANTEKNSDFFYMTDEEIADYINKCQINCVTLTGGEPLLQKNIENLISLCLENSNVQIEIETNGSVDTSDVLKKIDDKLKSRISFTVDYKTKTSGMEDKMFMDNFKNIRSYDTVKFVVGSVDDLETAKNVIFNYNLQEKCSVYISPVFGMIDLKQIAEFICDNKLNQVHMQIQMHKIIWNPDQKGV